MKKIIVSLFIGLSVMGLFMQYGYGLQQNIAANVLRLHILANSDSDADQALKLQVRDRVVALLSEKLPQDCSLEETKSIISQNLYNIELAAVDELRKNNSNYSVHAEVGNFLFPTKYYENFSLPRGRYDALRLTIGDGAGQNWWCVLYPNLCFTDGVPKMPDTGKDKLSKVLTEDELSLVSEAPDEPVQIKFRLLEWLPF